MARSRLGSTSVLAAGVALVVVAHGSAVSIPRCHTAQLRLAATFYGEAGGQFIQTFTFRNVSSRTCQVSGWPRLKLESRTGRAVATPSRRVVQGAPGGRPFRTVVLRSRGVGAFDVFGADWNHAANKACPRTSAVFITAPGARSPISVRVKMPNCGGFDIAPVIAGSVDRQSWSVVWP